MTRLRNPLRLKPLRHLRRTDGTNGYEWQAVDPDPQFLLRNRWGFWLPGWRMLEVGMEHDQASVAVKIYTDSGRGFDECQSFELPLKRGRVTKRLFYAPAPLRALRLDPMEGKGCFTLTH